MKPIRVLLVVLGGIAVVLAIACGVAFNSSFQTWAARRVIAQQPGLHGSLGSLSAGLGRVTVGGLQLTAEGAALNLPALELHVPLIPVALGRYVHVERLVARGWTLDLTKAKMLAAQATDHDAGLGQLFDGMSPNPERSEQSRGFSLVSTAYGADAVASPAVAVFRGVFAQLKLPVDLTVDGVELDGEVVMPRPGGGDPARLHVTLTGGNLAASHEGAFTLDMAEARNDGGSLTLHAVLGAAMDSSRTFRQLRVTANATASGAQFPEGVKMAVTTTAERTAEGESYTLTAAGTGRQLVSAHADFSSAAGHLAGLWALDIGKSDIEPFILGRQIPAFTATGDGKFESGGAWREIHATGKLNLAASGLGVMSHKLAAVGALGLSAEFDVLVHENSVRVERLDALLAGSAPVLSVQALQPFEFDWRAGSMSVADPNQELIDLSIDGLPLEWARPWLGKFTLTGGDVQGEFTGSARDGGLDIRAKSPLTVKGVTVLRDGTTLLNGLDLAIDASAGYSQAGWQTEVSQLSVTRRNAEIFSATAKIGRLAGANQPVKVVGRWRANLEGWSTQPTLADVLQLGSGLITAEVTANLGAVKSCEAKVTLANLTTAEKKELPAVTLNARVDVAADGRISFNAPVLVTAGTRKSDLLVGGTVTPGKQAVIEARFAGEQVYVDDMRSFAALVPAGGSPAVAPASGVAPSQAQPESAPFWNGVNGRVTLALQKAVFGDAFEVTNLGGQLRLEPGGVALDGIKAGFGQGSDLSAKGEVKFSPDAKPAYALTADVAVTNFDTASAFRALEPAKPPTIETKLNVTGHLAGTGASLDELAERVQGDLQLTGRGGIFRGLPVDLSDKLPKNQSTAAMIGGIIGAVTGKKDTADHVQDLFSLAKTLAEIPFDQLSVKAVRTENLDVQLQDFSLIAPELRLTGTGSIQHENDAALLLQPLNVQVTIAARGTTADLMKRMKLLDAARQDPLGYSAMVLPVTIGGSLEKPNVNQFATELVKYVLERTGILNSLLGK